MEFIATTRTGRQPQEQEEKEEMIWKDLTWGLDNERMDEDVEKFEKWRSAENIGEEVVQDKEEESREDEETTTEDTAEWISQYWVCFITTQEDPNSVKSYGQV